MEQFSCDFTLLHFWEARLRREGGRYTHPRIRLWSDKKRRVLGHEGLRFVKGWSGLPFVTYKKEGVLGHGGLRFVKGWCGLRPHSAYPKPASQWPELHFSLELHVW